MYASRGRTALGQRVANGVLVSVDFEVDVQGGGRGSGRGVGLRGRAHYAIPGSDRGLGCDR